MSRLRVILRCLGMALSTGAWTLLFWLGALPARLSGCGERWRSWVFSGWARTTVRVLGMQVETEGRAPSGRVLLVANHLSYVDIVLLASQMRCVFLSKSEVAGWPIIGRLARWMQTLFVERESRRDVTRVVEEIRARMARGQSVVFFPEGTSTRGEDVLAFRSALFEPAARAGWPVCYAAVRYFTPPGSLPASEAVCWWGDMRFVPHVLRLLALPGFRARIAFGPAPVQAPDRKSLARELHANVATRFGSLLESEESCPISV